MVKGKYNKFREGFPVVTSSGMICGYIVQDVFVRKFSPQRHIVRAPEPSIAIETFVLEQLIAHDVSRLRFFDGRGLQYACELQHFIEASKPYQVPGWPAQRRLPLSGWSCTRSGLALQLTLFAGEVGP